MFYSFLFSFHSEINRRVMKTVLSEVFAQFNGPDKTPWSAVVIEGTILPVHIQFYSDMKPHNGFHLLFKGLSVLANCLQAVYIHNPT